METRTRFVFLMHPKEFKHEKAATGRLTHLCLANSAIYMGVGFEAHEEVQALLQDPTQRPVLLYPGSQAVNLSVAGPATVSRELGLETERGPRRLVIIVLDATWALGRKMLRLSPSLQRLPRIMFTPSAPSRYVIKQQPHPSCLSTLEATHEVLLSLERAGLDHYPLPAQLLGLFQRMQEFQVSCAADPARGGYRRHAYRPAGERKPLAGRSGERRTKLFRMPGLAAPG